MNGHFNGLSPQQAELLAMLSEEAGEIVQAIGKILRHGYESTHPDGGPTNRDSLERELGDLRAIVEELCDNGDIDEAGMYRSELHKRGRIARGEAFMHHRSRREAGEGQ